MSVTRLSLAWMAVVALLAAPPAVRAQSPGVVYRVGVLSASRAPSSVDREAFWRPLRERGWVEGQNIAFEERYAEGNYDRLPALAVDVVRLKVDLIVAFGERAALAAKQATGTIPIVIAYTSSPVALGLVASLARPGGNMTGLTDDVSPEILGKQLQVLKEVVPAASKVAILSRTITPGDAVLGPWVSASLSAYQAAARALGLQVHTWRIQSPSDIDDAFSAMIQQGAGALLVEDWSLIRIHRRQILDHAARHRLPALYGRRLYVADGGLMAYGMDERDVPQRLAVYVDKILRGAKPADLPVEQPTKFELVINLKTAKALGLTIPPSVLARADEVIQ
jgi:putative tryptophan/tyrosine transport system substrate-binding protein